jgi:hypothetical protein
VPAASLGAAADYRRGAQLVREAFKQPVLTPLERRLGLWLFAYVKAQERDFEGALRDAEAAVASRVLLKSYLKKR